VVGSGIITRLLLDAGVEEEIDFARSKEEDILKGGLHLNGSLLFESVASTAVEEVDEFEDGPPTTTIRLSPD
jgi:hypothetical protein